MHSHASDCWCVRRASGVELETASFVKKRLLFYRYNVPMFESSWWHGDWMTQSLELVDCDWLCFSVLVCAIKFQFTTCIWLLIIVENSRGVGEPKVACVPPPCLPLMNRRQNAQDSVALQLQLGWLHLSGPQRVVLFFSYLAWFLREFMSNLWGIRFESIFAAGFEFFCSCS